MADYNINAVTRRVVYTGSAGLGPYAFSFEVLDQNDIAVYFNTTKLTLTTDYTVTINANGTGSITIVTGSGVPSTPDADDTITIVGARDIERTTDFVTAGDLRAAALNEQLDGLTIFDQQLAEENKRTLKAPVTDPAHVDEGGTLDMTLPAKAARLNKVLQFNATTGNPEAGPTADEVSNAQTYANNAATSAAAAAASASSASTSAATSTTKAAEASTSAASALTSETNAASSASSASTSAATATTKAGEASTSAANASTSETNSAASASSASTSAANASTSETNAASSASSASTSASSAASSATAAAASAASAASAYDSFDDRYLGVKASDPTVDNDGDPLSSGLLYFSSSENIMKVYDGASWIAATSAGNVSLILYEYTATSGQTTFSGADDNAATLSYTVNNIQVVMNGVILDPSDYTATNGTSVVLASGAALNDIVNIYAFQSFTVADTVSASAGGTFSANVAINGDLTVDTNTLYVDSTNNYVGIATASPSHPLTVNGQIKSTGTNGETVQLQTSSQYTGVSFVGSDGVRDAIIDYDHTGGVMGLKAHTSGHYITFATGGYSERMRINSSGRVHIGTGGSDPSSSVTGVRISGTNGDNFWLSANSGTSAYDQFKFGNANGFVGSIQTSGSSTSYVTSSDYRLKENITDITGAADRVKALNPVRFNFIADPDTTVDGFLAHEVQDIVPEAITGTKDAVDDEGNPVYQGIDQSKLVPLLTAALQEALTKIETLETEMASVKSRLDALETAQ